MAVACESCTFYDDHHGNAGKPTHDEGLCRFNPPITQPAPEAHGLWPVVGKEDWCGHYAADKHSEMRVA